MVPDISFDTFPSFTLPKKLGTNKIMQETISLKVVGQPLRTLSKSKSILPHKSASAEWNAKDHANETRESKFYRKQKSCDDCFDTLNLNEREAFEHPRKSYNFHIGLLMTLEAMKSRATEMSLD
jgi:hypothetical protein